MNESDHQLASNAAANWLPTMALPQRDDNMRALTPRQLDVLRELAKDQSNKRIGKALMLSPETVHHHLKEIFPKLGVNKRADAVAEACRRAIISRWARSDTGTLVIL